MLANAGAFTSIRKAYFRSAIIHDPAIAQLHDPFPVRRIFLRMRDLDDCHSLFVQSSKQLHDFFALAGMQISSRLIRQQ